MIVANIGVDPGFSAIYTSNSAMHTSFVQVALARGTSRRKLRVHRPRQEGDAGGAASAHTVLRLRQSC